jgi:Uncharacterized protein conserved in bacteria (DUF2330)
MTRQSKVIDLARRFWVVLLLAAVSIGSLQPASLAPACCPVWPLGKPVVNADQTVIILWDAATKTQHFIRQASFKSEAADFGFLIPTPAQPELSESGNEAFAFLKKLTEPRIEKRPTPSRGLNCGCGGLPPIDSAAAAKVSVLDEKLVAGFHAVVLKASSAGDLVQWLDEHDYAYSPEVEAWAKPYVDAGWKITALKVAKGEDEEASQNVSAAALRLTFKTDRPLFPYREPDSAASASALGANRRLLRIYFIGEARYRGELAEDNRWSGRVAWADRVKPADRSKALELLGLPEDTGPSKWWLTEFEDYWKYKPAPSDLQFALDPNQKTVEREPMIQYVSVHAPPDLMTCLLVAAIFAPQVIRKVRRRRTK